MQVRKYFCYALAIFLGCFLLACGEDQYQIDRKLDIALDTLYRNESKILIPQMDSICKTRYKTDLPRMVDSILALRKKQIQEQVNKLKNKPQ